MSKRKSKYIFVTGGVVSGLGKGITAASLGRLLKARGISVTIQKFDPYLNVDPGTMNPFQHGEVFVTDDGAETDLDLGHYERFVNESLDQKSNVTSGRIYWNILEKSFNGEYGGQTVQVIPHVTNQIKDQIKVDNSTDIVIIEIGGTVGDIESLPFLEAIRQFSTEIGHENCIFVHVTLVPVIESSGEVKTKPTQHSVKELQNIGIQPDIIVCRTSNLLPKDVTEKISLFCNVPESCVIPNIDVKILYEAPLALEAAGLAKAVCNRLKLPSPEPKLEGWIKVVDSIRYPKQVVKIGLVGKYIQLRDAYLSVAEALKHGGIPCNSAVDIKWIDAEQLNPENIEEWLGDCDGILVPGGFGERGVEGKILSAKYCRENKVPYFGICLGMQIAIIEFARNVLGLENAHSSELNPNTPYPVICLLPDQNGVVNLGGTLRLGRYPCKLVDGTKSKSIYSNLDVIDERHRHRYEVNNDYREKLESAGMKISGTSPDDHIVEMIELPDHPWFVATQAHPEFKSRPNVPHPLFASFIEAATERVKKK